MALDPSIYRLFAPRTVNDFQAESQNLENARTAGEANQLQLLMGRQKADEYTRGVQDQNALRELQRGMAGLSEDQIPDAYMKAGRVNEAMSARKAMLERQKEAAEAKRIAAQTGVETIGKIVGQFRDDLVNVNDPAAAVRHLKAQYDHPILGPEMVRRGGDFMTAAQRIPTDPAGFARWRQMSGLGMEKFVQDETTKANAALSAETSAANAKLSADTSRANNQAQVGAAYARIAEDKRQHGVTQTAGNQAVTYVTDPESGNLVAVPTRLAPGAAPQGRTAVGPDGKPIMGKSGTTGAKTLDAKEAIALLDQAEPLLKSATGSYIGKGIDIAASVFGAATDGSINAQKLKAIEGALVAKMPKMSGPQSDKDVMLYRQMAAQIGDDTIPYANKVAALDEVRRIQERYAGMPDGSSKPKPFTRNPQGAPRGAPGPAAPSGATRPPLDSFARP